MLAPVQKKLWSVEDYFRREERALDKHEFHEGEILAMSGNNYEHSLIAANLIREVGNRLKGSRCRPLDSNMRVSVIPGAHYVYPDVTIVCGEPQFDPLDNKPRSLLNPKVIIEILSESTEAYDRGEKFAKYRQIPSLEGYVLVSQFFPQIETFIRREDGLAVLGLLGDGSGGEIARTENGIAAKRDLLGSSISTTAGSDRPAAEITIIDMLHSVDSPGRWCILSAWLHVDRFRKL